MSLQVRLTLLFLLLGAPVLSIFGTAVYLVSRERLYSSVDESLVSRAQTVHMAIQRGDGPLTQGDIDASRRSLDRLALDGGIFEVLDQGFRPLYSSNAVFRDLKAGAMPARRQYSTDEIDGHRIRVLAMPLFAVGEHIGYVQATSSLDVVDSSVARIREVLIIGVAAVLLLTALPAYGLVGRALDPVRRVSRLAREIETTADFSRRLAGSPASGEMQELVDTFNRMVERIERMLLAQRAFLADSSHELRRPLTLLRTNIDVINDPGLSDSERRTVESEMRAEAESMSRLVANLGLLSREGQVGFDFKPMNLSQVCHRAIERARLSFPSCRFLGEVADDVWASLDEERFSQVLANLLQNAAAYSPDDGIVVLSLTLRGDVARIEVLDYGCGMSEADVAHAFDRFYRGSSAREQRTEGYGLGLAIVRQVVQAHGGTVQLASRLGQGTRVAVVLPICEAEMPISPARSTSSAP